MTTPTSEAAQKFDPGRAGEYEMQSRIAMAGYDACHELAACMLAASIGTGTSAHVLVVGAGGGANEVLTAARLEPRWRYTAVDPSPPMLDLARSKLAEAGLLERTEIVLGTVEDASAPAWVEGDGESTARLLRLAGGMLSSEEVAGRLGQTRQNVNELLKRGRLLAVRYGSRWKFPAVQFRNKEPLPGLAAVLQGMGKLDPWEALTVLVSPRQASAQSPLELLRQGDRAGALAASSRAAEEIRSRVEDAPIRASLAADLDADLRADRAADELVLGRV